ncbi:MAG: LysE family transporter [Caldilineaceae bacterium]
MVGLIVSSFMLGVLFAAPPGAITAEATRRGLARGFNAAWMVELGSLVGDALWAIIALIGAAFIAQSPTARVALGLLGGFMLLRLAWGAARDAWHSVVPQSGASGMAGDFATGVIVSVGNPFAIAFWLGVGGSTVFAAIANPQWNHYIAFFVAFMLGATAWALLISLLVGVGHKRINAQFFRWVNGVAALFLAYFGVNLLWRIY